MTRTPLCLLAIPLLGCPAVRGDDDNDPFSPLDTNEDGVLDEDDVAPGHVAAQLSVDLASEGTDGDPVDQGVTSNLVSLYPGGSGGWYLEATFSLDGGTELRLSMRFENDGTDAPAVASGLVTNVSANSGDASEWFGYGSESMGEVEITDSDVDVASGHYEGDGVIEIFGMGEQPTGETIVMHAFGFRDAPVVLP